MPIKEAVLKGCLKGGLRRVSYKMTPAIMNGLKINIETENIILGAGHVHSEIT